MSGMKKKIAGKVLLPVAALFVLSILVFRERAGIGYEQTSAAVREWETIYTEEIELTKECLILTSAEAVSDTYLGIMETVLDGMKVGYDICRVDENFEVSVLDEYAAAVVTFQDWDVFADKLMPVFSWVKKGGRLLTVVTPEVDPFFNAVSAKFGIDIIDNYPNVYGVRFLKGCMIGADDDDIFWYDRSMKEGVMSSLQVQLKNDCEVYVVSEEGDVPIVWTNDYGKGRVAVINQAVTEKYARGFINLAYTALYDAYVYPVINASAFYLDDFPSPVPAGNAEYIRRDYGVDVASFYTNVWWPKMMEFEKRFGIIHTGLIIENYSDEVEAPLEGNGATARFLKFGNMLLNNGGELGFHGYNHMPLCLEGTDEDKKYGDYRLWRSGKDIEAAVQELVDFSEELFPDNDFCVYVPPSNILSEEGRKELIKAAPQIKVIASTFLKDAENIAYEQEFRVEEDGVISTPRITSGCVIDDYQMLVALSELNYQYVQSHFTHPDDTLDEDRGAALGWEYMSGCLEDYIEWVYESAPSICNVTGSGMGRAVEKYDKLTLQREYTDEGIRLRLGSFSGEACFLVRISDGVIEGASGCSYEHISGSMYLLTADSDEIMIYIGGAR